MTKEYKKILIIDDSEVDREVLKTILSEEFSTLEAENGSVGVEKILKNGNSLDAILLDVSMPVMDGFGVLKRLEENRVNNIPVFLITAEATRENVANAARYHISGFIRKPYECWAETAFRKKIFRRQRSTLQIWKVYTGDF